MSKVEKQFQYFIATFVPAVRFTSLRYVPTFIRFMKIGLCCYLGLYGALGMIPKEGRRCADFSCAEPNRTEICASAAKKSEGYVIIKSY